MKLLTKGFLLAMFVLLFTSVGACTPTTPKYYTVNFYDGNNNIIDTQEIKRGQSAIAPSIPTKDGFVFVEWSVDFSKVTKDLDVYPIFEAVDPEEEYFDVVFLDDLGIIIKRETVIKGGSATAPTPPEKRGYKFVAWDNDFSEITKYTVVKAIYERENVEEVPGEYVKYVASLDYQQITSADALIASIDLSAANYTFTNIFIGGFRNANQMHYYDIDSYRSRNAFGYEVGVGANGIVVSRGTLVDLPDGGYILSGHTSTASLLETNVQIGDYLVFDRATLTVKGYRDVKISRLIGLHIKIEKAIGKINQAYHYEYRALNYELIMEKINEAIDTYNDLVTNANNYSQTMIKEVEDTLLLIDFLLVESSPIETKAFWHYPLRSGSYSEANLIEVQLLLDDIKAMGFNKVYLNVTFGGHSIYPSQYLPQRHANGKVYTGYKDYLECFIEEAHKRGIQVSGWTNTLICGDGWLPTEYSLKDWVLKGFNGEDNFNGMYFLDISRQDVQTHLINVFTELVQNYNLDGVEFDFIRFPGGNLYSFDGVISNPASITDGGYTDSFIALFKATTGFTGDVKAQLIQSKQFRTQWLQFKQNLLNDLVEDLVLAMRSVKPNISISGAIMPSISSALNAYQQNWDLWIENGWLDTLEPMIYNGDTASMMSTLKSFYEVVNGRADIVVGIFPEGNGGLPGVTAEQITRIIETYPVGWCKFSSKNILTNQAIMAGFTALKRHYTVDMTSSNQAKLKAYLEQLTENIEAFYQYCDQSSDYTNFLAYLHQVQVDDSTNINSVLGVILTHINTINDSTIKERLNQKHQIIVAFIK